VDRPRSLAAGNVDASGRVHQGERHRRQQGGDPVEERLAGAGTGQVEEDPSLGLFDLCCHFEERENHGRGLGLGQGGVLSGLPTQGMMEDIGRTGQEATQTVGQERRRRRAGAVEITFPGLAIICAMAAGAGEVLVQHLRRRGGQRGHDATGGIASGHHCGVEHHAPGAGPRRRRLVARRIETAPGREPLTVGRCQSGPLLLQTARFWEERFRVTEQAGVPGSTKDTIGPAPGGHHVHDLGGRARAVATDQAMSMGPALT
jgi:hypothetical protein